MSDPTPSDPTPSDPAPAGRTPVDPTRSELRARPAWTVRRTAGLLVPGFTKRFTADGRAGMTYLWRVPIGRFDMREVAAAPGAAPAVELDYRRWPVVDVLATRPLDGGSIRAAGFVRLPGGRRIRFCRFRLEHTSARR